MSLAGALTQIMVLVRTAAQPRLRHAIGMVATANLTRQLSAFESERQRHCRCCVLGGVPETKIEGGDARHERAGSVAHLPARVHEREREHVCRVQCTVSNVCGVHGMPSHRPVS